VEEWQRKAEEEARNEELQKARALLAQEQERRLSASAQLTRAKQQLSDAESKAKEALDQAASATHMRNTAALLFEKEQVKLKKQMKAQEERMRGLGKELMECKMARNAEAKRADEAAGLLEYQGTKGRAQINALKQEKAQSESQVLALQQKLDASYAQVCSSRGSYMCLGVRCVFSFFIMQASIPQCLFQAGHAYREFIKTPDSSVFMLQQAYACPSTRYAVASLRLPVNTSRATAK
jgi:multidrug efflux pump subunit AcrA (membrane-fusion protein)